MRGIAVILLLLLAPGTMFAAREVSIAELEAILRERERRIGRSARPPRPPARRERASAAAMVMPVAGVSAGELQDSFGDPRSGGRQHLGIDIFAPRWTEVVAVTAGTLTSVTDGARSGRSLWLIGADGRAYFYAHLQDWARGIHDGKRVRAGELLGYVGNSGNASGGATHLHFEVREHGRVVNPYDTLARAEPAWRGSRGGGLRSAR